MIGQILKKQLSFEGVDNFQKFISLFSSLYNIKLYKNGLDLILTKCRKDDLHFEIKLIKGWDTNVGCYLTEQNKVFNKIAGVFTDKLKHKIIIKSLAINVMAHEMAHALELESGLTLGQDFRKAIGYDMKGREPKNIALKGEINRLMVEQVKPYPAHQIISELFARYFELLSLSRDVTTHGNYSTFEVMDFFLNTTKWIEEIFNDAISGKIDKDIRSHTAKLADSNAFEKNDKFTYKVDSFHKRSKGWAGNVNSNAKWQKSWEQYDKKPIGIEKDDKNRIGN